MARRYAPRPAPGPIERALVKLPEGERAAYKAQLVSGLKVGSYTFTREGVTITASNWRAEGPRFQVTIAANDDRGAIPVDNPYVFLNPPVKIPLGTWSKVLVQPDPEVPGQMMDVPNYIEDPLAAIEIELVRVVIRQAKRVGWRP